MRVSRFGASFEIGTITQGARRVSRDELGASEE